MPLTVEVDVSVAVITMVLVTLPVPDGPMGKDGVPVPGEEVWLWW